MSGPGEPKGLGEFEAAWRRAAERPTSLAPAVAARRAVERARVRRRRRASAWGAAAAAALAGVALAVWRQPAPPVPVVPSPPPLAGVASGPAGEVVVMWLDEETPLYMTLAAPEAGAASRGGRP